MMFSHLIVHIRPSLSKDPEAWCGNITLMGLYMKEKWVEGAKSQWIHIFSVISLMYLGFCYIIALGCT